MGGYVPGTYEITITNAYFYSTTRDDGTPWDPDGLPDPYVVVRYEGQHLGTTAQVDDTVTPTWQQTLPAVDFPHMKTLTFDVFDEDGGDDELMFACSNVHADHSYFGWGRLLCDGEGKTIAFTVANPGAPVGAEPEPTRLLD